MPRKHGKRSDTYYLSPPGPFQMKKKSLVQAKLYQQHLLSTAESASATASATGDFAGTDDDEQLLHADVSSANAANGTTESDDNDDEYDDDIVNRREDSCTDNGKPVSPVVKRSTLKQSLSFSGSDDESSSDDSNASSTDVLLYSSHPSLVKTTANFKATYERAVKDFFQENGLEHAVTPSKVNGLLETVVHVINVTDPDNKQFGSTKALVKYLRKGMKKDAKKTASNTPLTLTQKHSLDQLLKAYSNGKMYGERTVRWHVHVISAISKLLNRTIIVVSPPLDGKSSVSVLRVIPTRYQDYTFHDGPQYFPNVEGFDADTDSGSESGSLTLNAMSTAVQQSIDRNDIIVSAVMNFETNQLVGYKGIVKSFDDYGLSDTDSDEDDDNDPFTLVIPTTSLKPRMKTSRDNDPFATPQPKKKKSGSTSTTEATAPPLVNPYKMQLQQGKSSSFTAVGQREIHVGGVVTNSSESCVDWGSSPEVLEQLNKKLSTGVTQNSRRGGLVLELTHGITDIVSGKIVHLAIISNANESLWYFKYEPTVNPSFALFFSTKGPKQLDAPASCYTSWVDSSIRSRPYGENKVLRRGRIVNGQQPYPKKYPVCVFETVPSGFPIDVVTKQFEATFRSMASDGSVMAAYFLNHLEETGSSLLNMFLDGKFRNGKLKNSPYNDANELKQQLKKDIEDTFKHGFARVEYNNYFDKHFCDFTIQEFLMKLGYHAWDELNENERKLIYKNNVFPVWDEIVEEPDRAS